MYCCSSSGWREAACENDQNTLLRRCSSNSPGARLQSRGDCLVSLNQSIFEPLFSHLCSPSELGGNVPIPVPAGVDALTVRTVLAGGGQALFAGVKDPKYTVNQNGSVTFDLIQVRKNPTKRTCIYRISDHTAADRYNCVTVYAIPRDT